MHLQVKPHFLNLIFKCQVVVLCVELILFNDVAIFGWKLGYTDCEWVKKKNSSKSFRLILFHCAGEYSTGCSKGISPQSVVRFKQFILRENRKTHVVYQNDLDLYYVRIHERQPVSPWRRSLSVFVSIKAKPNKIVVITAGSKCRYIHSKCPLSE